MGVFIFSLVVIKSYLNLGIPRVKLTPPWPAKWKVFKVICVDGYPMDCAAVQPTASPGSTIPLLYFKANTSCKSRLGFSLLILSYAFSEIAPKVLVGENLS